MASEHKCEKCGVVPGTPVVERISPVDVLYNCRQCGGRCREFTIAAADITSMPDDIAGAMLSEMYC